VHFVGLFFVFIIENARSKKQNKKVQIFHWIKFLLWLLQLIRKCKRKNRQAETRSNVFIADIYVYMHVKTITKGKEAAVKKPRGW